MLNKKIRVFIHLKAKEATQTHTGLSHTDGHSAEHHRRRKKNHLDIPLGTVFVCPSFVGVLWMNNSVDSKCSRLRL